LLNRLIFVTTQVSTKINFFSCKLRYYDQKYILERHAPFIGEIFAKSFSIAMRTASFDIFFTNDRFKKILQKSVHPASQEF
jgi:hypothetical protein